MVERNYNQRVLPRLAEPSLMHYLRLRQNCQPKLTLNEAFRAARFASSNSFYNRNLVAHFGCVNALEYSNHSQQFLATAGDDRRVLLWNVGEMLMNPTYKPRCMKETHNSNVFCLGFDNQNKQLLSSGDSGQVIIHDIVTGQMANMIFRDDTVYSLSTHPTNVSIFAIACERGTVHIIDMRKSLGGSAMCLSNYVPSFHGVAFNPCAPSFVAAAHSKEGVGLWDIRKPKSILLKYSPQQDSAMSVCFNEDGTQLFVLRRRAKPVLYNTYHSDRVATFEESGYLNSCTMKSGCFAGENDEYVISGSDDFGVYVWPIPERSSQKSYQIVQNAKLILKGHKSIVNQVRYSKRALSLVSCGVEKTVKLWSPFQYPGCQDLQQQAQTSRPIYTRDEYIDLVLRGGNLFTHNYEDECTSEDPRMLAFFDNLIEHDANQWSDISEDDLPNSSATGNGSSSTSLESVIRNMFNSRCPHEPQLRPDCLSSDFVCSSSQEDAAIENSIVSYYLRKMWQPARTAQESFVFARLRAIRAALAEEDSDQELTSDDEEYQENQLQRSTDDTHLPGHSNTGLGEKSAETLTSAGPSVSGATASNVQTDSDDSGCENEVKNSKTRQRNANRKHKAPKWEVTSSESSKAHCSRTNLSGDETAENAYDRSMEKLNRSVANTNKRLAEVAENIAQALNLSEDEENTNDEKG